MRDSGGLDRRFCPEASCTLARVRRIDVIYDVDGAASIFVFHTVYVGFRAHQYDGQGWKRK